MSSTYTHEVWLSISVQFSAISVFGNLMILAHLLSQSVGHSIAP
jgi:hypothetical protein